jgi:hypothetical protein
MTMTMNHILAMMEKCNLFDPNYNVKKCAEAFGAVTCDHDLLPQVAFVPSSQLGWVDPHLIYSRPAYLRAGTSEQPKQRDDILGVHGISNSNGKTEEYWFQRRYWRHRQKMGRRGVHSSVCAGYPWQDLICSGRAGWSTIPLLCGNWKSGHSRKDKRQGIPGFAGGKERARKVWASGREVRTWFPIR